ncbi:MAG TPA: SUMF1/EgtB/PvdO family nonheme iron enzyme [Acidobacteriota bacterium]|nr:SUMF1/EgtB/PvdO family nonheme iron enzyme [Acidobacteriota bacterium]
MLKRAAALTGFVCFSLLGPNWAGASSGNLGWHGEPLPEGLKKGEERGQYVWEKDQSVMVYVPAGWFPMGSPDGPENEQPVHRVYLDAYYIDRHEVSWRRWKLSGLPYAGFQFARVRYPESPDWGILDDHPVMSVNWKYADKYAQWAGKRLPSEAEWEKAARGTDQRRYPWGNSEPTFDKALWLDHPMAKEKAAPVDCCQEGASPYGLLNMAGNVYEWCQDYFEADYYKRSPERNPVNTEPSRYRVLRGGAFVLEKEDLRSALRYRLRESDRAPYIGFRTVISAPASDR